MLVSNRKGHQFHNTQRSRLQAQIRSQQVFGTEIYIGYTGGEDGGECEDLQGVSALHVPVGKALF